MKNVPGEKTVEKIKTQVSISIIRFFAAVC
jgi:hypothetical protein